jgi:hypothetical protein
MRWLDVLVRPSITRRSPRRAEGEGLSTGGGGCDALVPRRCAALVAEILKGSKPENRPVELPTKFWLALNLKTARQLDLEVSQTMLARADQLIE